MAENPHTLKCWAVIRPPIFEQIVNNWIEMLLRRVPRLEQVMMDARVIDGLNGRVGIGVSRQQDALRFRIEVYGSADKIDAAHFRHALVSKQKRHGFVPPFESLQR